MTLRIGVTAVAVVLVAGAAPALAQQNICGDVGAGGTWIGGAPGSSDIAMAGQPLILSGQVVASGGRAVGLFSLSQPMQVRVEAASDDTGDTVLELYDAAGTLVVTDDDSGGGFDSRAETDLAPGAYCLAARGFGGGPVTATLQVSRLEQPALTMGLTGGFEGTGPGPMFVGIDPCTNATPAMSLGGFGAIDATLPGGVSATNTVNGAPYYRFDLSSPQALTIRAANPDADPYIYLFDGNGGLLAENDDYESLNSRIDMTEPLAPGSYCIGMRALSDPDVPVTLTVAGFDATAMAAEQYASGETPPPADGSAYPVARLGVLPSASVRDAQVTGGQAVWYAMEIDEPGLLLITADEVRDADPVINFFDGFGNSIGMNDDSNGTFNSQLAVPVQPGQYMLSVAQYSAGYDGIIRVGLQRYVPAP